MVFCPFRDFRSQASPLAEPPGAANFLVCSLKQSDRSFMSIPMGFQSNFRCSERFSDSPKEVFNFRFFGFSEFPENPRIYYRIPYSKFTGLER